MLSPTRAAVTFSTSRIRCVYRAVARRCLPVIDQLPDGGQTLTERQRPRGIAVTTVMQPHAVEPGLLPDGMPVVSEARQAGARFRPDNHPGLAVGGVSRSR